MADSLLAIAQIAADGFMVERLNACASQQAHLGTIPVDPLPWVHDNRYVWASSPTWGEKWDYAKATHADNPVYSPGSDVAVITDADILTTVQTLAAPPESAPESAPKG
jgi:hypothetical protein